MKEWKTGACGTSNIRDEDEGGQKKRKGRDDREERQGLHGVIHITIQCDTMHIVIYCKWDRTDGGRDGGRETLLKLKAMLVKSNTQGDRRKKERMKERKKRKKRG